MNDRRVGLRQLLKDPGFTGVGVLTFALRIVMLLAYGPPARRTTRVDLRLMASSIGSARYFTPDGVPSPTKS